MRWRYLPFYLSLIFSLFLLAWRLLALTVVEGAYYRDLAEANRTREVNIRAPRGVIYDRHGEVLARNIPVYRECNKATTQQGSNVALEHCSFVTNERALEIEAADGTQSAQLKLDLGREYPAGSVSAHAVGYMGEVGETEIRNSKLEVGSYKLGDFIGRTGVEEQYEGLLRGTDGKELIETDALGKKIKSLGEIEPLPGKNLTLALDLDLQKVVAYEMENKTGAIVVSDPKTGEILALYSSPSFDPVNIGDLSNLGNLGDQPFFDRAISGLYPPGSVFKIITASAGLQTGKINAKTQIEDTGVINVGAFQFPNWYWLQYGKTEDQVDIVKALKRSNDTFFYRVGELVGIEKLEEWAKDFGLAHILGIDLPAEAAGRVRLIRDWYLGDTYHTAIGQGDLEVTPLQVNFWTNVIANGGKLCQPKMTKDTPGVARRDSPGVDGCRDIGLKKETMALITEGMKKACSTGGTGWPLFDFSVKGKKIDTACKTGTAEYGDPAGKTHAWFTVFAPISTPDSGNQHIKQDQVEPEISVTVLVEGGGEGSNVAAPIAKKILEEWFGR